MLPTVTLQVFVYLSVTGQVANKSALPHEPSPARHRIPRAYWTSGGNPDVSHEPLACMLRLYKYRAESLVSGVLQLGSETARTAVIFYSQPATLRAARRRRDSRPFTFRLFFHSRVNLKMPAGTFERASPSGVAAVPARGDCTPGKPRTLSENRKVGFLSAFILVTHVITFIP